MVWLLDSNVLIALFDEAHECHKVVETWYLSSLEVATCPITEGALMRYMVRQGQSCVTVQALLRDFAEHAGSQFWSDSVAYAEVDLGGVIGYRQVTDAYLAGLTRCHDGARLVTLDRGLALAYPDVVTLLGNPDRASRG